MEKPSFLISVGTGSDWGGSDCLASEDNDENVGLENLSVESFITDCDASLSQLGSNIIFDPEGENLLTQPDNLLPECLSDVNLLALDEKDEEIILEEDTAKITSQSQSRSGEFMDNDSIEETLGLLERFEKNVSSTQIKPGPEITTPQDDLFNQQQQPSKGMTSPTKSPAKRKSNRPSTFQKNSEVHVPLRVLIVEDNPITQRQTSKQLEKLGHTEVFLANNGKECLQIVKSITSKFDVILLDLHMPEMDGFETCVELTKFYHSTIKPVITAITASDSTEEAMKCLQLGFEHYLAKPILLQNLMNLLNSCKRINYPEEKKAALTPTKSL